MRQALWPEIAGEERAPRTISPKNPRVEEPSPRAAAAALLRRRVCGASLFSRDVGTLQAAHARTGRVPSRPSHNNGRVRAHQHNYSLARYANESREEGRARVTPAENALYSNARRRQPASEEARLVARGPSERVFRRRRGYTEGQARPKSQRDLPMAGMRTNGFGIGF